MFEVANLSRTLLTAGVTILVLSVLFPPAAGATAGFPLMVMLGVGVAAYSSASRAVPLVEIRRTRGRA